LKGLLKDRVALITGAAGAIGRAVARRFFAEGADLCPLFLTSDQSRATTDPSLPWTEG
jgi:NAD(P)-dependent dehydrogenase (short-subunit alcohol dehydrogenase family)